jgi:Fic family protein
MGSYIHQLPDWPKFHWNQAAIATSLANIRHRQGRLIGRMEAIGFSLQQQAQLETLTLDVLKTSEIEGENLNADQVRSSIARRLGMDIAGAVPADRHVEGVVEMMLDATQNFAEPLDAERLFAWNAALFPTGRSGMQKIVVGNWRNEFSGPMQVVSGAMGKENIHYEAPLASRIDTEMSNFIAWINGPDSTDAVLRAALGHLWFVTIHPFEDGNGRIARAIADLLLARSEGSAQRFYSMSAQIRHERAQYYNILEQTQRGTLDITEWMQWFLGCLGRAFDGTEITLVAVFRKARFWDQHTRDISNERQRHLLNKLLDGFEGKLTTAKWATIAKCSHDTALRDIQQLIDRGVLRQDPGGGRSTSYSIKDNER